MQKVLIDRDETGSTLLIKISEDTEIRLCTAYTVSELEAIGAVIEELLNGLATARILERRREEL